MNVEAQIELNRILSLDPNSLTVEERAFLFARRTYLTTTQKKDFENVLISEQQRVDIEAKELEEEKNPKQSKA